MEYVKINFASLEVKATLVFLFVVYYIELLILTFLYQTRVMLLTLVIWHACKFIVVLLFLWLTT